MFAGPSRTIAAAYLLVAASAAGAQSSQFRAPALPGFAAIVGVVDDSIRGGPLAGATVIIVGTTLRATTDANGFFRIDSVAADSVQLAVLHPMLDSLLIAVTSRRFPIQKGDVAQIAFSSPPLARFHDLICPRGGVNAGSAMIVGRVDLADADRPVPNATVSLVYNDPGSGSTLQRVRSARSRSDGLYAICGLPESFLGTVQVQAGAYTSAEIPITLKAGLLATASFLVGKMDKADSTRSAATLTGRVTDVTGKPIRDAQIAVEGGTSIALTGDDGTFTLRDLPSGTTTAVVRKIGFAPANRTVHLQRTTPQRITAALTTAVPVLATVKVTAAMDQALKKVGFEQRRVMGSRSNFLYPADIEKMNAGKFTDLFRTMAGFRVTQSGFGATVESTRAGSDPGANGCVNIFVDRVAFEQMTPGDLDASFPITQIAAVEGYPSVTDTPAEFRTSGGRACATIVAWTKNKLSKP